tara:strand:+ start:381 stop:764 length:384 start_codon:yes stop_codon:yes gene_type:complete
MEFTVDTLLVFCLGFVFALIWNWLLGLGTSVVLIKNTINDCLLIMAKNIQTAYQSNEIKYLALQISEKDEKYIEFQKRVDNEQLVSLQNTIIRNFINSIPPKYNHLVKFGDWESAINYLNSTIKKDK